MPGKGVIRRRSDLSSTSSVEELIVTKKLKVDSMEDLRSELDECLSKKMLELREGIVEEILSNLEAKWDKINKRMEHLEDENKSLRLRLDTMSTDVLQVRQHAINNEQYSRRNNIRIMGLPEAKGENCLTEVYSWIRKTLHADIKDTDIQAAHRLKGQAPRPTIVSFVSRQVREKVISNRRVLKGSGMVVVDDLCREIYQVFNRAKANPRVKQCWTWRGKVWAEVDISKIGKVPIQIKYGQPVNDAIGAVEERYSKLSMDTGSTPQGVSSLTAAEPALTQ